MIQPLVGAAFSYAVYVSISAAFDLLALASSIVLSACHFWIALTDQPTRPRRQIVKQEVQREDFCQGRHRRSSQFAKCPQQQQQQQHEHEHTHTHQTQARVRHIVSSARLPHTRPYAHTSRAKVNNNNNNSSNNNNSNSTSTDRTIPPQHQSREAHGTQLGQ